MILPGHVAASWLCHRYLKVELRAVLAVAVVPDLIDKSCYYILHLTPTTRVPMHTLLGWLASTLLVAALDWVYHRGADWRWTVAWFVGYAAHLLCDSLLTWDPLPFLYPFISYPWFSEFKHALPFGFLFGLGDWSTRKLLIESALVAVTVYLEIRRRGGARMKPIF